MKIGFTFGGTVETENYLYNNSFLYNISMEVVVMDKIELGGNICLEGFSSLERAQLVVVKKMVGSYARAISEKGRKFEKFTVSMDETLDGCKITAALLNEGKEEKAESSSNNLFVALDGALKKL